jgi:hypothetical protein
LEFLHSLRNIGKPTLENLSATFERSDSNEVQDTEKLYAAIGQLKVENELLKKVLRYWG